MPKQMIRKLLVCSCFVALGGCQFLGSLHLTKRAPVTGAGDARLASASRSYTQAGRDHLRGGSPGLAIDAYNLALAGGEDPAAAYNGLGVAYARIGRPDLAYRFFHKAVMSDPHNPVYARNLGTLVDSPSFTLDQIRRAEPTPQVAAAQPAPTAAVSPKPRVAGRLYRDSNRQFSLTTQVPTDSSAVNGTQTAALGNCTAQRSARRAANCRAAPLPTMHSRQAPEAQVAVNSPAPSGVAPVASNVATPSEPAALAPKGKRKSVNMIGTPRAAPQDKSAPDPPSLKPATT